MADTVSELLPCPFCGSNDVELRDHGPTLDEGAEICCNNCGALTGKGFGAAHVKKAITAWNTRASMQPAPAFPREEVRAEALEEAAKIAEAHRAGRIAAKQNALDRKQKSEARDHESMAIEAIHIATAIRAALLQGKHP